jgi:hypothetical protein
MQEQHTRLTGWQAHALIELTGILGSLLEYERPQEITARLRTITNDLEQLYEEDLGTIGHITLVPSTRPEIRALGSTTPEDALDFLQFHSPD